MTALRSIKNFCNCTKNDNKPVNTKVELETAPHILVMSFKRFTPNAGG